MPFVVYKTVTKNTHEELTCTGNVGKTEEAQEIKLSTAPLFTILFYCTVIDDSMTIKH